MLKRESKGSRQRRRERRRRGRNPPQPPAQDDSLRKETRLEPVRDTDALRDEALDWDLDGVLEDALEDDRLRW